MYPHSLNLSSKQIIFIKKKIIVYFIFILYLKKSSSLYFFFSSKKKNKQKRKPIHRSRSPNPDPKKNQLIIRNHYLNAINTSYAELMKKTHETMNTSYQKLLNSSLIGNSNISGVNRTICLSEKIKERGLNRSLSKVNSKNGYQHYPM